MYIPGELRQRLMIYYHFFYGHVGIVKLIRLLRRRFDWPGLTTMAYKMVNKCDECQTIKKSNSSSSGPLHSKLPSSINELVAIDYYDPLPVSRSASGYVIFMQDFFSKFTQLFPTKFATATSTMKAVEKWIHDHGKPAAILSDNGPQFRSEYWAH